MSQEANKNMTENTTVEKAAAMETMITSCSAFYLLHSSPDSEMV
jgi:hypothetical protein